MASKADDETLIVVVADTHVNSLSGLCPPAVTLDGGGTYRGNKAQRVMWSAWREFWEWIDDLRRGRKLYVVINGDAVDIIDRKSRLITTNKADVLKMGIQVFEPVAVVADCLFIVRGTEVHTGGAGALEEALAYDLGAVKDEEVGAHSWWWLNPRVGGVLFDIQHHPATWSRRPWTKGAAPPRQAAILAAEYAERGTRAPDVAVRSHVHQWADSGLTIKPRVIFTPPWQFNTPFSHRLGAGGHIEPPGGVAFICCNGENEMKVKRFPPRRRKPWQVS